MPRKRKWGILVAYNGKSYRGVQLSPDFPTIEKCLLDALHRKTYISDANMGELRKISWSRNSRTDKGVHSISTVFCCKLEPHLLESSDDPFGFQIADSLNLLLPKDISCISLQRISDGVNARFACSWREYEMLFPKKYLIENNWTLGEVNETILKKFIGHHSFHNFTSGVNFQLMSPLGEEKTKSNANSDPVEVKEGDFDEEVADDDKDDDSLSFVDGMGTATAIPESKIRRKLPTGKGIGTNNWRRSIIHCYVKSGSLEDVSINNNRAPSFCILSVKANSFLLHQIRKMMTLLLWILTRKVPVSIVDSLLTSPILLPIPPAPEISLIKVDCGYEYLKPMQTFMNFNSIEILRRKQQLKDKLYKDIIFSTSKTHNEPTNDGAEGVVAIDCNGNAGPYYSTLQQNNLPNGGDNIPSRVTIPEYLKLGFEDRFSCFLDFHEKNIFTKEDIEILQSETIPRRSDFIEKPLLHQNIKFGPLNFTK